MIAAHFVLALAAYSVYAWASYTEWARASAWFLPGCLALALTANLAWILLVRRLAIPSQVFVAGLAWDFLILAVQLSVPWALGAVNLRPLTLLGAGLVVAGILLANWSLHGGGT